MNPLVGTRGLRYAALMITHAQIARTKRKRAEASPAIDMMWKMVMRQGKKPGTRRRHSLAMYLAAPRTVDEYQLRNDYNAQNQSFLYEHPDER